MSFMDYIPHKWALNKSLRKEADKLKSRLDSYQVEYERRMKECNDEIEKAKLEKDADLERLKKSLEQELQYDQKMYEDLLNDLIDYTDVFLQRKFLCILKKNKSVQANIISEDINFIKSQMDEIGTEINLLQKRKTALSAFTNVQDIISLTNDCGYDVPFSSDDDADSLLKKVNEAIDNCSDDKIMRLSLFRLRGIVYERSEYLSIIKYIEWVIQQKKDYRKQLRNKMQSLIAKFKTFRNEINKVDAEIKTFTKRIDEKSEQIRFYWMRPITYLDAEIDYASKSSYEYNQELTSKKRRHKSICLELKEMKEMRSHDQVRWNSLQSELNELSDDINLLKSEIEEIYSHKEAINTELDAWYEKRNMIKQSYKNAYIEWESNKALLLKDEKKIIAQRLYELEQIAIEGVAEAEAICHQEKDKLIAKYTAKREAYLKELEVLSAKLKETKVSVDTQKTILSDIKKQVKTIKENDDRFFIAKWFFDTRELTAAKEKETAQSAKLSELVKIQNVLKEQVTALNTKISDLSEKHENDLKRCHPKPLRPTSDEKHEEEILKLRQKNIRERKNGN
jgi:chromosome segregation ATPase